MTNIENYQPLGTEGEEPCSSHRHSEALIQDEHKLKVDGRGPERRKLVFH